MRALLDAKADVNGRLRQTTFSTLGVMLDMGFIEFAFSTFWVLEA